MRIWGALTVCVLLTSCAGEPYDYTAYHRSNPSSILVLPPVNHSVDIKASPAVLSQLTHPLAEAGYYVFPVSVVEETFKHNGVTTPDDIEGIPFQKLHQIFGADAALYTSVESYGTSYQIISSVTTVRLKARLIDLRSGAMIWTGQSEASDGSSGLLGAAINQIASSMMDHSFPVAGAAAERLLNPNGYDGILYGPKSPEYGKEN